MKKAIIISYLILFFFILATCAQKIDNEFQVVPINYQEQVDLVKAKQIIDNTCLKCHSATASMQDRLAPPLEAVKRHYLAEYPVLDDFTHAIATFVSNPTDDKSLLRGAVRRFNVMPAQEFSEEDLVAVATYIYQFDLEKPDWFEDHFNSRRGGNSHQMNGQGQGQGQRLQNDKENCECGFCTRNDGNGDQNGQRHQHRRGQGGS